MSARRDVPPTRGRPRVLIDGWYGWLEPDGTAEPWVALTAVLSRRLPKSVAGWLLARGWRRGGVLALLAVRYDAVAVIRYDPGWRTLLCLRALAGRRRKLIVLQFFDHVPVGKVARRVARWEDWVLRRSLACAQVLTEVELHAYPIRCGIPPERFALVRFAARSAPAGAAPPDRGERRGVVAAGRAHCDWATLFAAAAGGDWDLQVVVGAADAATARALARRHGVAATVRVELPGDAVTALLERAAVAVLCVHDGVVGRGHVRLAAVTDAGAAIVASDVRSRVGYVDPGRTALLVPPGAPEPLRDAVQALLDRPQYAAELAAGAWNAAEAWTGRDYLSALRALTLRVLTGDGTSESPAADWAAGGRGR